MNNNDDDLNTITGKGEAKEKSVNSAFISDNPDFDQSRDCPQARGADSMAGIIANSIIENE